MWQRSWRSPTCGVWESDRSSTAVGPQIPSREATILSTFQFVYCNPSQESQELLVGPLAIRQTIAEQFMEETVPLQYRLFMWTKTEQQNALVFPCQYFKLNNKTFTKFRDFQTFTQQISSQKTLVLASKNGIASIPKINPSCTAGSWWIVNLRFPDTCTAQVAKHEAAVLGGFWDDNSNKNNAMY